MCALPCPQYVWRLHELLGPSLHPWLARSLLRMRPQTLTEQGKNEQDNVDGAAAVDGGGAGFTGGG